MNIGKVPLKKVFAMSVGATVFFFLGAMFGGVGPCTASLVGITSLGLCFLSAIVTVGCVAFGTYRVVIAELAKRKSSRAVQ